MRDREDMRSIDHEDQSTFAVRSLLARVYRKQTWIASRSYAKWWRKKRRHRGSVVEGVLEEEIEEEEEEEGRKGVVRLSILSLRLSVTSHGQKYRAVREVQSASVARSRFRSFPDSRKNPRPCCNP